MRNTLKLVSLADNAPSTLYFDTFLLLKKTNIELFFTIDEFSGRVHTPISSFHRPFRSNILINSQKIASLDVVTMQPLLLGKILKNKIGENDYSNWINSGEDIYLIIQDKAKLSTRDEAKKRFFEILFSKPNKLLSEMFGNSNWIEWINSFKGQLYEQNPHTLEKNHSNLAWLLQTTEVNMMRKVWQSLKNNGIIFLSVHDEVIIQTKDLEKTEHLFSEILNQEFEFYKLSSKVKPAEIEIAYNHIKHLVAPAEEVKKEITNFFIDKNERAPVTNENWNRVILELENFFKNATLPTDPVKLNHYSSITNVPLFIESHFATVKLNNGNRTFLPHLHRLQELKNILANYNLN